MLQLKAAEPTPSMEYPAILVLGFWLHAQTTPIKDSGTETERVTTPALVRRLPNIYSS